MTSMVEQVCRDATCRGFRRPRVAREILSRGGVSSRFWNAACVLRFGFHACIV